jgi:hypothetical protein
MNTRAVAVASLILLAGCGGGSSAPAPIGPVPTPVPTASPAPGTATLTLGVPRSGSSAQRAPRAAAAGTTAAFLVVTVKTVDGQPPTAAQVPTNPQTIALSTAAGGNCTTSPSGETCTVTIPAPPGVVTYQFDVLDASNNKLATTTATFTITPGTTPHLSTSVNGIVASVVVTVPTLNAGTPFNGPITVQAFDAGGTLIVGSAPYSNPITLTDNDTTGATSLSDGTMTGLTVTVGAPSDVVNLSYTGTADDPFTIGVAVSGKPPTTVSVPTTNQPVVLSGTTNDTLKPSDPNYNQATLFFTTIPSTQQFGAAQPGWGFPGHAFVVTLDAATCGSGASAVVTVTPVNSSTFSVTSKNAGICKGTVTGGPPGHPLTATVWFSVSASQINVN